MTYLTLDKSTPSCYPAHKHDPQKAVTVPLRQILSLSRNKPARKENGDFYSHNFPPLSNSTQGTTAPDLGKSKSLLLWTIDEDRQQSNLRSLSGPLLTLNKEIAARPTPRDITITVAKKSTDNATSPKIFLRLLLHRLVFSTHARILESKP